MKALMVLALSPVRPPWANHGINRISLRNHFLYLRAEAAERNREMIESGSDRKTLPGGYCAVSTGTLKLRTTIMN